jgi:hypothetical protein
VIVDLLRSNESGEIGFLADTCRMNVALTRARRFLLAVADSATLGEYRTTPRSCRTSTRSTCTAAPGPTRPSPTTAPADPERAIVELLAAVRTETALHL